MKKVTCSAALISLLLSLLVCSSCGSDTAQNGGTSADQTSESISTAESEQVIDATNVLDLYEKKNMDGKEFNIITSLGLNAVLQLQTAPEDTQNGDIVNDALYDRDRILEDYFNASIVYNRQAIDKDIATVFQKEALAGETSFDFAIGSVQNTAVPLFNAGVTLNLNNLPYIDLDNDWYTHSIMDNFIYNGNYHMIVGEFSPRNVFAGNVLIFNLKEHENRGLPNFYDLVREGKWTLDAFEGIIKGMGQDLDGDGTIAYGDFFGLNVDSTSIHSLLFSTGNNLVTATDSGINDLITTDKSVRVFDRIATLFLSDDVDHDSWKKINTYAPNESFMEGKALFNLMVIVDLTDFRDSETDYGIVPLPKYDEVQDRYISLANTNVVTAICLPKTTSEEECEYIGLMIEAMTALGHYKSIPEAYEATLLTKLTRDDDSVEMLSIVNESLALDLGYVYNLGGIHLILRDILIDEKPLISVHEQISSIIETEAQILIEAFMQ